MLERMWFAESQVEDCLDMNFRYVNYQTLAHLSYSSYVCWISVCATRAKCFLSVRVSSIRPPRSCVQFLNFVNKIFVISRLITKFTKILCHENLELYSMLPSGNIVIQAIKYFHPHRLVLSNSHSVPPTYCKCQRAGRWLGTRLHLNHSLSGVMIVH